MQKGDGNDCAAQLAAPRQPLAPVAMQVGISIWLTLCVVGMTRASSCAAAWLLLSARKAGGC